MKKHPPSISVVMAVNKDDGFLDTAINSILNQTFTDFEFIVVANACTDDLWEKLCHYRSLDDRIILARVDLGGLAFSLNYGASMAKSPFIARMDADDVSYPKRLEIQWAFLSENDVDVLATEFTYIDEEGNSINESNNFDTLSHDLIKARLQYTNFIKHPTVVFKKSAFIDVGGYKYGYYGEDYDLWLRLASAGYQFHILPLALLGFRIHSNQMTDSAYNKKIRRSVMAIHFLHNANSGSKRTLLGLFSNTKFADNFKKIKRMFAK